MIIFLSVTHFCLFLFVFVFLFFVFSFSFSFSFFVLFGGGGGGSRKIHSALFIPMANHCIKLWNCFFVEVHLIQSIYYSNLFDYLTTFNTEVLVITFNRCWYFNIHKKRRHVDLNWENRGRGVLKRYCDVHFVNVVNLKLVNVIYYSSTYNKCILVFDTISISNDVSVVEQYHDRFHWWRRICYLSGAHNATLKNFKWVYVSLVIPW